MTRRQKKLLRLAVILATVYLAMCVVARLVYPRALFHARKLDAPGPTDGGDLLALWHADGSHTAALYWPPATADRTTILYFHGNGDTIFDLIPEARALRREGLGVLLVEYRGYGTTYGPPPSEASLYEDGEAAFEWLSIRTHRIALLGYSLGTGVASEMAFRGHGSSLVLLAPFTSLTDMGRRLVPILPARPILLHRLDTLEKAPKIQQPTLVIHGEEDPLIPIAMGVRIAQALPHGELIRVHGGSHADLLVPRRPGGPRHDPDSRALFARIAAHVSPPP